MPRRVFFLVATFLLAALPAFAATTIVDGTSNTILAGETSGYLSSGVMKPPPIPPRGSPASPSTRVIVCASILPMAQ